MLMFNHCAIRRDFHNGTAGLAHTGTVCRPTQNSGFVTLLNYGQGSWLSDGFLDECNALS